MYESTFEGFMVARLNETPAPEATNAYERHLSEAWAAYDAELTHNYQGSHDHG